MNSREHREGGGKPDCVLDSLQVHLLEYLQNNEVKWFIIVY